MSRRTLLSRLRGLWCYFAEHDAVLGRQEQLDLLRHGERSPPCRRCGRPVRVYVFHELPHRMETP